MRWFFGIVIGLLALALIVTVFVTNGEKLAKLKELIPASDSYAVDVTDYNSPAAPAEELFTDDEAASKQPAFDPGLIDSRLEGDWQINLSAALIKLDVPMILPDREPHLLQLYPSYAQAIDAYQNKYPHGSKILPSINMIDGKAKQFDDGLYAAIDQAYFDGIDKVLTGHVALVRKIFDKLDPKSPAAAYLAADLTLAEIPVKVDDQAAMEDWLQRFRSNEALSKPAGFYTWNKELERLFIVLRFLQQPLPDTISGPIAQVLKSNPAIKGDYARGVAFYEKLTNPRASASLLDLMEKPDATAPAYFFPPATSKENRLFEELFPMGLPPDANLMKELVSKIRSGAVNLAPKPDSGWYDYQVYALETLLLPEKGAEASKLVLTRAYKKRMLEAFQALITKRRETHYRNLMPAAGAAALPLTKVKPRLRLEPAPTYYLRTARAYDFLSKLLEANMGTATLKTLHGLKADGKRDLDLATELNQMRELFYGCYFLSAEDIGLKPELLKDEAVDGDRCKKLAEDWLGRCVKDLDLAADTRVAVPIYTDRSAGIVRCWGTLGVRLAKLDASFATAPSVREAKGGTEWKKLDLHQLDGINYLIPVDDFAEFELRGMRVLNRKEFRELCNQGGTKEKILTILQH